MGDPEPASLLNQVEQQWHGYLRGHQLLKQSIRLSEEDQDLVDKLSDASGPLRPGERYEPCLTAYPLPSGRFYVLAKTWQNLEAPRAGAVETHSLLIPTHLWAEADDISPFLGVLRRQNEMPEPIDFFARTGMWPPVHAQGGHELAEALFLEAETSVVAFGFNDEELMTARILQSLWPEKRKRIAVCSHALAPRSLKDRNFDLLLAPPSAKSRFAKWQGRKVDNKPSPARHTWTRRICEQVFVSAKPDLADLDAVGILDAKESMDSSSLRLALRFGDLRRSASNSPQALLGMVDIVNSLDRNPWSLPGLSETISDALDASVHSEGMGQLLFLSLLVRKLDQDIPLSTVRRIIEAARNYIAANPSQALAEINENAILDSTPLLYLPTAAALLQLDSHKFDEFVASLGALELFRAMSCSPEFATLAARSLGNQHDSQKILELADLANINALGARKVSFGISRGAISDELVPLVDSVLSAIPEKNISSITANILKNGVETREELMALLVRYAGLSARDTLLELALDAPSHREGDLILRSMVESAEEIDWLASALDDQPSRLAALVGSIVDSWSDSHLARVLRSKTAKKQIEEAVFAVADDCPERALRVIEKSVTDHKAILKAVRSIFLQLPEKLKGQASQMAMEPVFQRIFDDKINDQMLTAAVSDGKPVSVILAALNPSLEPHLIGRNLSLLAMNESLPRFSKHLTLIVGTLQKSELGSFGLEGYESWQALIKRAARDRYRLLNQAAEASLEYAFRQLDEPAYPVVSEAFPIVYKRLANKGGLSDVPFNFVTAWIHVAAAVFGGDDQAEIARSALIDAYLNSVWEPSTLLETATKAGIRKEVVATLKSRSSTKKYLKQARQAW